MNDVNSDIFIKFAFPTFVSEKFYDHDEHQRLVAHHVFSARVNDLMIILQYMIIHELTQKRK